MVNAAVCRNTTYYIVPRHHSSGVQPKQTWGCTQTRSMNCTLIPGSQSLLIHTAGREQMATQAKLRVLHRLIRFCPAFPGNREGGVENNKAVAFGSDCLQSPRGSDERRARAKWVTVQQQSWVSLHELLSAEGGGFNKWPRGPEYTLHPCYPPVIRILHPRSVS